MANNLTLQEYADIKESIIEEIVYYASGKGISIPIDGNYILDEFTLKQIDPILHHQIKYRRPIKPINSQLTNSENNSKSGNSFRYKEKNKNPKFFKRIIGIVKRFRETDSFGFIVSSSKGISDKNEDLNKLFEFFIRSSEWESGYIPSANELVVFTPKENDKGWIALNAKPISHDFNGLLIAMDYRGVYSAISGIDSKGIKYNDSILSRAIDSIRIEQSNGPQMIVEVFAKYISSHEKTEIPDIIKQFVEDANLIKRLIALLPKLIDYKSEIQQKNDAIKYLLNSILEHIFDKLDIEVIFELPHNFSFESRLDKTYEVLVSSMENKSVLVKKWLNENLNLIPTLLSVSREYSFGLLYLIYEITKELSVFEKINKPWYITKSIIEEKSESIAEEFLLYFFEKTEQDLTPITKIDNKQEKEVFNRTVLRMLKDSTKFNKALTCILSLCIEPNLKLISAFIESGIDISTIYKDISDILSQKIKEDADSVREFDKVCTNAGLSFEDILSHSNKVSDEMLVALFIRTADEEYLNRVEDFSIVPLWLNQQNKACILRFLQQCQIAFSTEEDIEALSDTVTSIAETLLYESLKDLETNEQYKLVQIFPDEYARNFIAKYFASTAIFSLIIGEQWQKIKAKMPYVVFDLESDGDNISEFAFKTENNIKVYEGDEQLNSLLRTLEDTDIIVGHRIKEWDLGKVLSKRGFKSNAFVWDTLEIEILLNPCRYSYALRTKHTAKEDTELTDSLFWNQLFRLSQNNGLCVELKELLPSNLTNILQKLQVPIFADFFKQAASEEDGFYQVLVDTDENVINSLNSIHHHAEAGHSLVIAPKRLWPRIAQHVNLSFIQEPKGVDFLALDKLLLKQAPLEDTFLNAILGRFIKLSKTPIIGNIAQYLRINYLKDELLINYASPANGSISCADLSIVEHDELLKSYKNIYFVGCEMENRINQYSLPTQLTPSDFWSQHNSIPMRLGASNYIAITPEERKMPIFNEIPETAANAWIERSLSGRYIVNYNYDFHHRLNEIKDKIDGDVVIEVLPWSIKSDDYKSIFLVHSKPEKRFDARVKRVCATSRYRATYWTYQFALLNQIHNHNNSKPIILFLDDLLEKDKVENYARSCGYYIPNNGTLIRKLELIEHHSNGLLIVSKDQFFDIVDWRKDSSFCYVWDHLAVEKHMMMWKGISIETNKSFLDDEVTEKGKELSIGSTKDTYQSILISLWPVYEYYYRFIKANSIESSMYVLDSFMEEYHTLSSVWETSNFEVSHLWIKEKDFLDDLSETRKYFDDSTSIYNDNSDVEVAMEMILATLIKSESVKSPEWTDIQKEILPLILKKEENYLVSLPTGGGKSVLFQGPALYNSAYSNKLSIVVTPLKALMQDQVKELGEKGFITNVDYLNGDRSYQEVKSIYRKINGGEIAILYVTPERFRSRAFINALTTRMSNDNGLEYMVFDEAHCISQWGMEFRPEYLNVIKKCQELSSIYGKNMCIAMFSATVTDMIYNQINEVVPVKRLGQDNDKKIYNPIRSHIGMEFKEVGHNIPQRLKEIVEYIEHHKIDSNKSRMLVFCKTRMQCEEISLLLADSLSNRGIIDRNNASECISFFHAGMDGYDREDTYTRFKDPDDPLFILCATKAFGMGMDIPNIHYIVHYSPPSVMEDYLQEVGRAGRNEDMYKEVGFSVENPIPTICLWSKEDIKKAKEQLIQGTLSWNNLEAIRIKILNYISQIQTIEQTKEYPIVIPNTLWARNQHDNSFTAFRIGMYWLERMGRIKMGYLSPAHINISIQNDDKKSVQTLSVTLEGKYVSHVMSELRAIKKTQSKDTIQVSIQEIASRLSIQTTRLLDTLILCSRNGLIEIEENTRCRIAFTRLSEVSYMLHENNAHDVTLHIILNTVRQLLQSSKIGKEKSYTLNDIKHFIQENDTLEEIVKEVERVHEDGKTTKENYMYWYKESDKNKNKGLSLAKSYHKDLYEKRIRQVFTLLEIIPDVKVHSYLDTTKKAALQSVIVEKSTWQVFIDQFQEDCMTIIKYVDSLPNQIVQWSKTIVELGLDTKGFAYFENVLRFLNGMGYVAIDPLTPTGIEVYTTTKSKLPIYDNIDESSDDFQDKKDFDEANEIRSLRLCVMDVLTKKIKNKQDFQQLISAYFSKTNASGFIELLSNYYDDSHPMWEAIRATAIKNAEEQLKDNPEQWAIYNEDSNTNVNVEAGPGSGKTHILTLKCAKLIYHQHVKPQSILVLAYNRAIVVELKRRLTKLFGSLGLSRSASQLHVYTFHGLAKRVCGEKALEGKEMKEWEAILLDTIKNKPNEVRNIMPDLQYILIDEFQDITQIRLDAMFTLKDIFNPLTFFTIGDKDQSIYGFEKKESMDPNFYYDQLYKEINPKKMTMNTNYRSYPKILEAASQYLPDSSCVPVSCKKNKENEPKNKYTYSHGGDWSKNFEGYIKYLQGQNINDLAVFFRTNNEVYHGYSLIKTLNIPGIRIRIQGVSAGELYRMREFSVIFKYLEAKRDEHLKLKDGETENELKKAISSWIEEFPNWDAFYFNIGFVLILDYLDLAACDEESHTYYDMAESIREALKEDNPQLYNLYEDKRFLERRISREKQMNVILTTMHKVKGLEFDAVMITPSVAALPLNSNTQIPRDEPLSENEEEQIQEERRLQYVAYTRARKFLIVYKGLREESIENNMRYTCSEDKWGICEKEIGLANYNIGFNTGYNFRNNQSIGNKVKRNDPVSVRKERKTKSNGESFTTVNIVHNGINIGQLSKNSSIFHRMEIENINILNGFFVSDVFYWTYQDTLNSDKKNNTRYADNWCEEAKDQRYIFIVNIAGYGSK